MVAPMIPMSRPIRATFVEETVLRWPFRFAEALRVEEHIGGQGGSVEHGDPVHVERLRR